MFSLYWHWSVFMYNTRKCEKQNNNTFICMKKDYLKLNKDFHLYNEFILSIKNNIPDA